MNDPLFFVFAETLVRALVIGLITAGLVVIGGVVIAIFTKPPQKD